MATARYLDQPYLLAGRRIDPITGTLSYREAQKHLRRKELEVLAVLAEAGTDAVPRGVFIQKLWPTNPIGGEQGLSDAISALRRALQDTDRENPLILTIPRQGYQLRASVRLISRDGGVAFVAGTVVEGRPDWRLKQLLERTDAHESWLAEDGRSRRIFRFCRNEQQLRKLRREIVLMRYLREALARVENVSTILDWQLEEPPYYLELAAPACGNLRGVMLGKAVPEVPERWRLLHQVADALAAVNAAGVVHRNLAPDSVLVDRRDGERVALLGEFGLAALHDRQRLAELGIDAAGLSLKTALPGPATPYTAPECAAGAAASAASDVYALGVLIVQTVRGDFQQPIAGFEDFPAGIAGLLQRCGAANPADRPSAAEVAARLREWTQPRPAPRTPVQAINAEAPAAPAVGPLAQPAPVDALPQAATALDAAPPLTPVPLAQQYIDRYRIVSELAQGGMGVVYLAEQSEPVQRRVALKLIRAGLDCAQVLARFEAERQALAMMNHPNISAIFDAGTTSGGYPYFVMEFVPGKDIVRHCDDAKLDLRARIRLFLQVCDGVLHAHQKGLIHRDLKPNNILVKHKSDHAPLVKLIDFGVAKSLAGGPGAGLNTRVGGFIGTPVYSCPEQVIDPTRDIDTRADLYSLGVVLYEILSGVPPRSAAELDADTPAELARRLRDTLTPPMGSRYNKLSPEEQARIAELRTLSTEGLSMQLGSDLDWIVGKCIAVDPEDRYATVQELRLELQRWLDDRPIEARPASAWYRFRKLVRRNRLNTALVSASVLLLISTVVAVVLGYTHAQSSALRAQQAAEFQSEQIKSLNTETMGQGFRSDLISAIEAAVGKNDPANADDKIRLLHELMDGVDFTGITTSQLDQHLLIPGLQLIKEKYAEHPDLQAMLRQSSADTLVALGLLERALDPQEQVIQWHKEHDGPNAAVTLNAQAKKADILFKLGRADAVALLDETITAMRASNNLNTTEAIQALTQRSSSLIMTGKRADARLLLDEALGIATKNFGPDDIRTLRVESEYQAGVWQLSNIESTSMLVQRLQNAVGSDHPDTLKAMERLANNQSIFGLSAEAVATSEKVLASSIRLFGESHRNVAVAQSNLARYLARTERYEEAVNFLKASIENTDRLLGSDSNSAIVDKGHLGAILLASGKIQQAMEKLERATNTTASINGKFSIIHQYFSRELVKGRYWSGDLRGALERLNYIANDIEGHKNRPDWVASGLEWSAKIMLDENRHQEALDILQRAIDMLHENDPRHQRVLLRVSIMAEYCKHLLGEQSTDALLELVSEQQADKSVQWMDVAESAAYLAAVHNDLNQPEKSIQVVNEGLARVRKIFPEGHYAMLPLLTQKIRAAQALKKPDMAKNAHGKSLRVIQNTLGLDPRWRRRIDIVMAGG